MQRRTRPSALKRAILLVAAGVAAFALVSLYVQVRYAHRLVARADVPSAPFALVFGAGLQSGEPSPVLAERLDAAAELFRAGKVQKILLSGDNSDRYHDETLAMRRYLISIGLPATVLVDDDLGLSTYDSCARALGVYGVKKAILVTQRFHLPRALFIANALGMEAWGVAADEGLDRGSPYALREWLSRPVALAMVIWRVDPPREKTSRR